MSSANFNNIFKRCFLIPKLAARSISSSPALTTSRATSITEFPINYKSTYFKRREIISKPRNVLKRYFSSAIVEEELVDSKTYEKVCEETLDSLAEYFEELVATEPILEKGDIMYGAGVLTLDLGSHGTYVINRQSPNRQIWLSSPTSGPKRYDYSTKEDCWIYKHDGNTLHCLLKSEIGRILGKDLQFSNCTHCKL